MPSKYVEGEVYFRVTYGGITEKYPTIETFVFVGMNLSDEDVEDTWYFQPAEAVAELGTVLESSGGDRIMRVLEKSELSEMMDIQELVRALESAQARRLR
jgi:hypothetical protein